MTIARQIDLLLFRLIRLTYTGRTIYNGLEYGFTWSEITIEWFKGFKQGYNIITEI